jgi:hypothetical protein
MGYSLVCGTGSRLGKEVADYLGLELCGIDISCVHK